ncbi:hypothetical protein HanRHA438_Chr02g0083761 [Helianthus annuus]|nr:hypothetical protein HanRHA438_Chr02g0083761 [Helianthus annuus]
MIHVLILSRRFAVCFFSFVGGCILTICWYIFAVCFFSFVGGIKALPHFYQRGNPFLFNFFMCELTLD